MYRTKVENVITVGIEDTTSYSLWGVIPAITVFFILWHCFPVYCSTFHFTVDVSFPWKAYSAVLHKYILYNYINYTLKR